MNMYVLVVRKTTFIEGKFYLGLLGKCENVREFFERECENHTKVSEFFFTKTFTKKIAATTKFNGSKEKGVGFSKCLFLSVLMSI